MNSASLHDFFNIQHFHSQNRRPMKTKRFNQYVDSSAPQQTVKFRRDSEMNLSLKQKFKTFDFLSFSPSNARGFVGHTFTSSYDSSASNNESQAALTSLKDRHGRILRPARVFKLNLNEAGVEIKWKPPGCELLTLAFYSFFFLGRTTFASNETF